LLYVVEGELVGRKLYLIEVHDQEPSSLRKKESRRREKMRGGYGEVHSRKKHKDFYIL